MKRRIFGRFFFLYALIILLAGLFSELSITATVRNNYLNDLRNNLLSQATLISDIVSFSTPSSLDILCVKLKEQTGYRVTVISLDGRVLGDSDRDSSTMENHRGRPEVREALAKGSGMSMRHSDTLQDELLYVAIRVVRNEKTAGFIRLSKQLRAVDAAVNSLRIKIFAAVISILLTTGLFSIGQMERIRRLTRQIGAFSRSLAGGAVGNRLYLERAGEFDEIAESLNAMSMELQNTIAASEEEKNRLTVILRSVPDVLMILDSQGIVQLSSAASRSYFGDAPLRGKQVFEVIRNPLFLSLMDDARRNLTAGVGELRLDYPEERYFSARVSPLSYKESELSGFVVILHDITQLTRLEQTRKDFVANISHEIKTPITSIKGFADTLLEGALHDAEHAERFLTIIKSNSERINSLVDDLMTISKIELGVAKLEKAPVAVPDAVEQVMTLLQAKAAEKNLFLKKVVPEKELIVSADRDKLIQVLTNLVDNAIKFTEKGGITITAGNDNGKPYIFVEDTGIGILEKHLLRLGERFYRVDTARSRKMGGTGLGLAIVKHIVKAHGWDMQIESVPEKGTKVKIFCTAGG